MDYKPMMCLTEYDEEATHRAFRREGYEDGLAEGERKKAVEAARNFLKMQLGSVEQISQATALPLEEVQKLADELAAVKA